MTLDQVVTLPTLDQIATIKNAQILDQIVNSTAYIGVSDRHPLNLRAHMEWPIRR